jgi:hypothetical protein
MTKYPISISESDTLQNMWSIRHIKEEVMIEGSRFIRIHTAWKMDLGVIMVHEYNSCNQPSSSICFFNTLNDYNEVCEDLDWVRKVPLEESPAKVTSIS